MNNHGATRNHEDWIPHRDADFDGFFFNLKEYVKEKTTGASPEWTHIPQAKLEALEAHYESWHAAYDRTLPPHSGIETAAKNSERTASEAFLRPFSAQYLQFEPVTNEDRLAMGVHNRDRHPSKLPAPSTRCLIDRIEAIGSARVRIWFRDETEEKSQKVPYGDNGALLNSSTGPERVTDYDGLTDTQLMTRSPWTKQLPAGAVGKWFSCATRWQSDKSDLGPWGDIHSVMVS
ncbi:MAG: hypothetical protein MdMp014T_0988 [Treponematales bacterium]